MFKHMRLFLVGMAMGVANIIPGVSGGTIAVVFGIYEQLMEALGNFLTDKEKRKEHILFLAILFSGSLIAVVGLANILKWSFEHFPLPTVYFFMGLILGSIPVVYNSHTDMKPNIPRILSGLIAMAAVIFLALLQGSSNSAQSSDITFAGFAMSDYLYFVFCGAIAASAMIIPGVSGSFILILLGIYWTVLGALSGLTSTLINSGLTNEVLTRLYLIAALGLGVIIGILGFSKIMSWTLKRFPAATMYAILGLIIGSFYQIYPGFQFNTQGFVAIGTALLGLVVSLKFSKS